MDQRFFLEKAKAAYASNQLAYAAVLCNTLLQSDPTLLSARELLRDAHFSEWQGLSKGQRMLRHCQATMILLRAYFVWPRNSTHTLRWLEKACALCPVHRQANLGLAQIAKSQGSKELEIFAYQTLHRAYPAHIPYLRHLGQLYLASQAAAAAQSMYTTWMKLQPHAFEAIYGLKNAIALQASLHGRWEKSANLTPPE